MAKAGDKKPRSETPVQDLDRWLDDTEVYVGGIQSWNASHVQVVSDPRFTYWPSPTSGA